MEFLLMFLLSSTALFLIVLVLIQRGKGGGLAGAFGGMGGQSAFGSKASDLFTRVTIFVAVFWIFLCIASFWMLGGTSTAGPTDETLGGDQKTKPGISATTGATADDEGTDDTEADGGADASGD